MNNKTEFSWVRFYMELADKLVPYATDRKTLISKVRAVYDAIGMRIPTLERDNKIIDIDPFTIFGLFNKSLSDQKRISIVKGFANKFAVKAPIPQSFEGIPLVNNMSATFYWFVGSRQENDIQNLWNVFLSALKYADTGSADAKKAFVESFDVALEQKGVKWNLTMALFWIRPYSYLNLDSRNRWFITNPENMPESFIESLDGLATVPTGEKYLEIIAECGKALQNGSYKYKNFLELSHYAWVISEEVNEQNRETAAAVQDQRSSVGAAIGDQDVHTVHYWVYSPGYGSVKWEEFYQAGIMAIAREYIGDLRQYATRKEMQDKMRECGGDTGTRTYKNASLETWQFLHELKPGDVIFAKSGLHTILGRGVVTSEYIYDESQEEYRNIRKVNWTHKGEWAHPGNAITKVLTDVTVYTEYVEQLNALFVDEEDDEVEETVIDSPVYTEDDFLNEVYMSSSAYNKLRKLLMYKKNVILQGAPGVGKTFAAKRLAYSIMGQKDPSRVMMIQFHQSYSYEDFIMGFRPASTGFELKKGPFYTFCKKAEQDPENDYFFIIDEINRGNLSKIFGELFMLIEGDKRGTPLQLLYSDEKFAVPSNLYIIGMMNTADRSLAMLDYALRRRFAFYEFVPAFDSDGFCAYCDTKQNEKFNKLIAVIQRLNADIEKDAALGKGFRIGHSYFCTEEEIDDLWLDSIITYEILPLLEEYWFDEPETVHQWELRLREAIR